MGRGNERLQGKGNSSQMTMRPENDARALQAMVAKKLGISPEQSMFAGEAQLISLSLQQSS